MKKRLSMSISILSVLFLLSAGSATAQSKTSASPWRLGIGVEGLMPTGNLHDVTSFGLGITPKLQYGLGDKLALTFTSGYYNFFGKRYTSRTVTSTSITTVDVDGDNLGIVPVKTGLKAFVSSKFYFAGEAGAAFETNGTGNVKLDLAPSFGYVNKAWDISGRYEHISGSGSYGFAALRVAYGFSL